MKICRLRLPEGIVHAAQDEDQWVLCRGSLEAGFVATEEVLDLETDARWLPPVIPPTIYAIGLNYKAHAIEMAKPIPEHPVVTMKSPTALLEPGGIIRLPRFLASDSVDFECELGIIIGRRCKNVSPEDALNYVFGYTAANDVSARDWQKIYSGGQWCKGKTFDTFCPIGPVMVTADEISDPDNLEIATFLNGESMQSSNTSDMIFSVAELVAFLSGSTTLEPGTLILSGTPTGVGVARNPPRFLQDGDSVIIEIQGIGRLENSVREEQLSGDPC